MSDPLLGRLITAMVTPFTEDNQVNYAVAEELAAYLVENGSESLVICGTTGESPTLSWEEEHELFQVVKQAVAGKAKIIAGTGSNCTQEAIAATRLAASLGLDASLQVVPYYNKPPQAGLYEHFRAIAKAAPDLPMMLYNIPGRTGQSLTPETVAKLAEIDNIIAVKEASGNLDTACAIRTLTPDSFAIYAGDDFMTLPLLTVGGIGVVSVASHLVGKEIKAMLTAFLTGDTAKAVAMQLKLYPLFKVLFCTTNPIPVKAALKLQGWSVGSLRLPLVEISSELEAQLAEVLSNLALINKP
ncbi:MAG: 4-hydroxy-tetrahydrodipicolinate synthase [Gloeocapsa sp. DLM2.Bin57]|jgi:4-hydroxy-tetrahydrodipicolinate synthase|nr:MAG: 4-hydroxy-tetrahydrodipicolinate synthase [Gloeocapsa sp. DLM2.Bin57]